MSSHNMEEDYDSEEDDDFVPQDEAESEEGDNGANGSEDDDDPDIAPAAKKRKLSGGKSARAKPAATTTSGRRKRSAGLVLSDEEDGDAPEEPIEDNEEEEEQEKQVAPERPAKVDKKAAEVDDLWAMLNSGKKPQQPAVSTTTSTKSSSTPVTATTTTTDTAPASSSSSKTNDVDDLWAALNSKPSTPKPTTPATTSAPSSAKLGIPAAWLVTPTSTPPATATSPAPAAEPSAAAPQKKTNIITEKYDFAGETITITKEVEVADLNTKGRGKASAAVPATGLGGLLAEMKGKKKMSALQKSALDWHGFREKDDEIKDELEQNKKDGYLAKQAFLSRVDWREFENERDERSKARRAPSSGGGSGGM